MRPSSTHRPEEASTISRAPPSSRPKSVSRSAGAKRLPCMCSVSTPAQVRAVAFNRRRSARATALSPRGPCFAISASRSSAMRSIRASAVGMSMALISSFDWDRNARTASWKKVPSSCTLST